jgi:hypothetical protein
MIRRVLVVVAISAIGLAPSAMAVDKWEGALGDDVPNPGFSVNLLSHGLSQEHDLDEASSGNDQDWMVVPTLARHSYEARISGSNVNFDWGICSGCAQFERVDSAGVILTEDRGFAGGDNFYRSVLWTATATGVDDFMRVRGSTVDVEGPNHIYTIRFWDTTYSIPRWNNSSGQVTVFLIQNVTPNTVAGLVDFYTSAGVLLTSQSFTIAPNSMFTFNTSTLGALAGQAGHAYVSHDAGYGGLAGKAVALEPATGFSFDTQMTAIPD